jgi:hypothetical protein
MLCCLMALCLVIKGARMILPILVSALTCSACSTLTCCVLVLLRLQVALRASCAMRPSFSTWSHHNLHQPLHSDVSSGWLSLRIRVPQGQQDWFECLLLLACCLACLLFCLSEATQYQWQRCHCCYLVLVSLNYTFPVPSFKVSVSQGHLSDDQMVRA